MASLRIDYFPKVKMMRAIALIMISAGAWMMIILRASYAGIPHTLGAVAQYAGAGMMMVLAVQLVIPVLKVAAGMGLFMRRRWGRVGIRVILIVDVVALGISVVRYHIYAARRAADLIVSSRGAEIVATHSIVPTYIVILSSMLLVIVLSLPVMRRHWEGRAETA